MADAFNRAWDLVKMPFVEGSVRPVKGRFMEGDEDHAPEQMYEADFYDPVDDITRRIEIEPARKWIGPRDTYGERNRMHRDMDRVTAALIDLRDEEGREPEQAFGVPQVNPFSAAVDGVLSRTFVPSDLRGRGLGTGLMDALAEYYKKVKGRERGLPLDRSVSAEMLSLLASRNLFPEGLEHDEAAHDPNEEYFRAQWDSRSRWPGSKDDAPPMEEKMGRWKEAADRTRRIRELEHQEMFGDDDDEEY